MAFGEKFSFVSLSPIHAPVRRTSGLFSWREDRAVSWHASSVEVKNVWSCRQTPIHTVMVWCFIRRQKQNPKEVAEITDRKTSKSQQENCVLLGAYAAVIYCAADTWNHACHSKLHLINAFKSTAPSSNERVPWQLIINKRVCFCLQLRWCNKLLVSLLHSSAETSPSEALYTQTHIKWSLVFFLSPEPEVT
jgi:hypothetical protein